MPRLSVTTTYINPNMEAFPYRMTEDEGKGLYDLLSLYSPHNVFRKVVTYFGSGGGMPIHAGHSEYYDFDYVVRRLTGLSSLSIGLNTTLFAGGKGYDIPGMFLSSLSEAFERVLGAIAFFKEMEKFVHGSYKELVNQGYNCLSPDGVPLFAEEQYQSGDLLYERFTEDSSVGWIEGSRLISRERVWVPAQLVLLFYSMYPKESLIGYATSGGLASHINEKEALFHGIAELIERDAVNLRWNCKIAPERVQFDREPRLREMRRLLEAAEGLPGKPRFYLHTVDIEIPVVTVKEIFPCFKRYAYYAGGGADIDIELAMLKALIEYGQAERSLRLAMGAPERGFAHGVRRMFDVGQDTPVSKIDIFFKIVAFYGYQKNYKKMDWYLEGGKSVPLSSLPEFRSNSTEERFDHLMQILKKYQIDPIIFNFTPPQMRQIKLMKVYIPEITPPYLHSSPLLGHPRYYEVPYTLGLANKPLRFSDLNSDPLPYP